jgi:hypothetical protein
MPCRHAVGKIGLGTRSLLSLLLPHDEFACSELKPEGKAQDPMTTEASPGSGNDRTILIEYSGSQPTLKKTLSLTHIVATGNLRLHNPHPQSS